MASCISGGAAKTYFIFSLFRISQFVSLNVGNLYLFCRPIRQNMKYIRNENKFATLECAVVRDVLMLLKWSLICFFFLFDHWPQRDHGLSLSLSHSISLSCSRSRSLYVVLWINQSTMPFNVYTRHVHYTYVYSWQLAQTEPVHHSISIFIDINRTCNGTHMCVCDTWRDDWIELNDIELSDHTIW